MASVWRVLALATVLAVPLRGDSREHPYPTDPGRLRLADVFELEWASDPQISPDGERVVYVRNFMDVMHDRRRSNLWLATTDGGDHRPLTTGLANHFAPRWSPDGRRLLYASTDDGSSQLHVRWLDGGGSARLTQLREPPADPAWSPDGRWIAFTMLAPLDVEPFVELPEKPAGAQWAAPAVTIDELLYRADGAGYLKVGNDPTMLLTGEADHRTPTRSRSSSTGAEAAPGGRHAGAHSRRFARHRRPSEPAHEQGSPHPSLVRALPGLMPSDRVGFLAAAEREVGRDPGRAVMRLSHKNTTA
jgi:hypothetical protein